MKIGNNIEIKNKTMNNWEKEFDERFSAYWSKDPVGNIIYGVYPDNPGKMPIIINQEGIKQFISDTLKQQREEIEREMLEPRSKEKEQCNCGYQELLRIWGTEKGINHNRNCPKYETSPNNKSSK